MPTTLNYGWTTPVVNGDFGAWGGILNTAFSEIDADLRALSLVVAAGIANVAKTNLSNTFTVPQVFGTVTAGAVSAVSVATSGAMTATGLMQASQLRQTNALAANDTTHVPLRLEVGADGVLGPLGLELRMFTSAASANRIATLIVGDTGGTRKLALQSSQVYVGPNTASFVGSELLRVEGAINATSFVGSGAGLTAIPQSAVTNLTTDVATLTAAAATANATATSANGTANTALTNANAAVVTANAASATANSSRPFATAISDNVPVARVNFGTALGYATQAPLTGAGGRSVVLTNFVGNTNATLEGALRQTQDLVSNLVNDLKTRGVV